MTKDILVRVRGTQNCDGVEDTIEIITPGTYYEKNGKRYFIYEESLDETEIPTKNTVKLMDDHVEIMKRGRANTRMSFEPGKHTTSNYQTPLGLFIMGITTSLLEVKEEEERILIKIQYSLEMNGSYAYYCDTEILASAQKDEVLGIA